MTRSALLAFLVDATPLRDQDLFARGLAAVSPARREKALRCRSDEGRAMRLGAGLLLRAGLALWGADADDADIFIDARGKPWCRTRPDLHFSLSHSGGMVFGVFSDAGPTGADIERDRACAPRNVAERFFHPDEKCFLHDLPDETRRRDAFLRIWTLKESYAKATGLGIAATLSSCSLLPGTTQAHIDGVAWHFREYALAGWKCAVCGAVAALPSKLERVAAADLV